MTYRYFQGTGGKKAVLMYKYNWEAEVIKHDPNARLFKYKSTAFTGWISNHPVPLPGNFPVQKQPERFASPASDLINVLIFLLLI